jgi:xanthine dehydrogenase accessory factor
VDTLAAAYTAQTAGEIPVIVDPDASIFSAYDPLILVDARMLKTDPGPEPISAPLTIGLGPGFEAPHNCDAVIETNRGHYLGHVIWQGSAQPDTGMPEGVMGTTDRVLRAPTDGTITAAVPIGSRVEAGDLLARVDDQPVTAPFAGVLRGLIHDRLYVRAGLKIGDLDPRGDPAYSFTISDKALAIGGGVLEAILSSNLIRDWLRQETS